MRHEDWQCRDERTPEQRREDQIRHMEHEIRAIEKTLKLKQQALRDFIGD